MKTKIRCLLCAMLCVCLGLPTAFAATITPSVTQISLPKGETKASFDVILTVDKDFAGAEFGLKPSADDVTLKSLQMLGQIGGDSPVQADKNGVHYFGFFTGSNAYKPGTYKVARLTYTYTGSAARTVTLASSKIVTVNEDNKTTEGDTSTQPFTVTITRAGTTPASGGGIGGGIGGGGGGGGGGTVSPAPGGTTTPGDTTKNPFTDVAQGAYYYDAVQWAVGKKITSGTSATTFTPDGICTRAQTVTFLWRSQGSPKAAGAENPFTDVSKDAYYYDAVLWAVEQGITNGTSAITFSPDATVTRGQTAAFLWRVAKQPQVDQTANPFADVTQDAYYYNAVLWAVAKEITNGTSSTTFSPDQGCTRAQIVTFLWRTNSN